MPRDKRFGKIKVGSFAAVIRAYLASAKFDALAPSSKTNYRHLLELAERPRHLAVTANRRYPPRTTACVRSGGAAPAPGNCCDGRVVGRDGEPVLPALKQRDNALAACTTSIKRTRNALF